jgi:homoserine O-acetyltransferase
MTSPAEYYTAENHGPFELFELGRFELEEGGAIDGCQLAYTTFGELSPARDNAILVPTWYSGTHGIMGQLYVGEGRALDPARYFIVVVDQIGSGMSTSPHHGLRGAFPRVRIGDDVRAQDRLLRERFGIEELQLVVGGSMGGQQTYDWAVRFPDRVRRAAPLAANARTPAFNAIFVDAICDELTTGPAFADGAYDHGAMAGALARHARLIGLMGFSTEFWRTEHWRRLGFDSPDAFVEGFLVPYFAPMDPNDLLCQAWKWQHGDVGRHTDGDLAKALGRIRAKTYVMPIDTDLFFPLVDCRAEQELIAGSELRTIATISGHLGLFAFEPAFAAQVDAHLRELLETAA